MGGWRISGRLPILSDRVVPAYLAMPNSACSGTVPILARCRDYRKEPALISSGTERGHSEGNSRRDLCGPLRSRSGHSAGNPRTDFWRSLPVAHGPLLRVRPQQFTRIRYVQLCYFSNLERNLDVVTAEILHLLKNFELFIIAAKRPQDAAVRVGTECLKGQSEAHASS